MRGPGYPGAGDLESWFGREVGGRDGSAGGDFPSVPGEGGVASGVAGSFPAVGGVENSPMSHRHQRDIVDPP